MALIDRRIKLCPNPDCKEHKKTKFKVENQFCSSCGASLVLACKKCGARIEDLGPKHTICANCEAKKQDDLDHAKEMAKTVAKGAAGAAVFAAYAATKIVPGLPQEIPNALKEVANTIRN